MGLLTRFMTLARADAHGVVDALEDKSLMLRQHLRQAGEALERKRCRVAAIDAEDKDLQARQQQARERIEALEEDISLALAGDQEDLARYAIKKLLPRRHGSAQLERRRQQLAEERAALEEQLADQQAEYELLEQRVRGFLAQAGQDSVGGPALSDPVVTDQDVELELLRRRQPGGPAGAEKGGG